MKNLISEIKAHVNALMNDIDKVDNKAARARARRESLILAKLGKEYRKKSLEI